MSNSPLFVIDTKMPYLSFFRSCSNRSLSIMPLEYYNMKDKIKDIASHLGGHVKPFWLEVENCPCYVWPGNPNWTLRKLYSLADMNRAALPSAFTVSSDRRLGAITDDQSRIALIDLHRGTALRFWKGCKDSQTCFVDVTERFTPAGRLSRRARYILIYLPRLETLEVWSLIHGPLLKSWSVNGVLRFLPQHAASLNPALKHFNALCALDNERLIGLKLSFDLWLPHTPEADDFKQFSRLRSWITSRTFKKALKSKRTVTLIKLNDYIGAFSEPDWFLKAIWVLLRTHSIDLSEWLFAKLPYLSVRRVLSDKAKQSFKNHLTKITSLLLFYLELSKLYRRKNLLEKLRDRIHNEENEFITPVLHFFPEVGKNKKKLEVFPLWTFFRAVAHSHIFQSTSDDLRHRDKSFAYETILGQAIFIPYFSETIAGDKFISFLENGPFPFDYLLILATRCLLTESNRFSPCRLARLTQELLSSHPEALSSAFVTIYSSLLGSRNHAGCLVLCASIVAAEEALKLRQKENSQLKAPLPRSDSLLSNLKELRIRCHHLQDMIVFNSSVETFGKYYNFPPRIVRAFSVHHIFKRGPDHFTSEFARHLAASHLTGHEIMEIYRRSVSHTNNNNLNKFQMLCLRLPHSFEINRILVVAAWWMIRQIASPWTRVDQTEKFKKINRVVDYLSVTSNAGHGIAFFVASQCFNRPLSLMLKAHFTAIQCLDFFKPSKNPCLLDEALHFCEFVGQYRRVSMAAMEESPLYCDKGWEDSFVHSQKSIDRETYDKGHNNSKKVSSFPLRQNISYDDDLPTFSRLDAWFQLLVIQTAILAFGMPPLSDEIPVRPVQLLPDSWSESFPFKAPIWTQTTSGSTSHRSLHRRGFIRWFIYSAANYSDSPTTRVRLFNVAKALAHAWGLPSGFVRSLTVLALYAAWEDGDAESEVLAFADAPIASDLFYLLLERIRLLDKKMDGKLVKLASQGLLSMLVCLHEDEGTPIIIGGVPEKEAPPPEEQVIRARRLVDLLKGRLVGRCNQRTMTEEIGELLDSID
nr:rab3 GTPase activating protein non catalytic [Hymenolepis microstoma]